MASHSAIEHRDGPEGSGSEMGGGLLEEVCGDPALFSLQLVCARAKTRARYF